MSKIKANINFSKRGIILIEPIKEPLITTTTIQQGNSRADVRFIDNGFAIKFQNSTPEFTAKVVGLVDSFSRGGKQDTKTLEMFKIDTFERG